jgi:neutral ceramidase
VRFLSRLIRITLIILTILTILLISFFKLPDKTPYQQTTYYRETVRHLENIQIISDTGALEAGWAVCNITPHESIPISSYGIRKNFEKINDSVYTRVFTFRAGKVIRHLVTVDLLLFPPEVLSGLKDSLGEEKLKTIFFSATHTHNGPGGWINSPAERFIAGPFNKKYTSEIISSILAALRKSENELSAVKISAGKISLPDLIQNRVVPQGKEEDTLRFLEFVKKDRKAVLAVFNAHANCLNYQDNSVSADYPGATVRQLENNGYEMAAFCAGAVGSMKTDCGGKPDYQCVEFLGQQLSDAILKYKDKKICDYNTLAGGKIQMFTDGPSPRIFENLCIRPWTFNLLMGKSDPYISFLKIGEITFLGYPCDFSAIVAGKIYSRHANLIITSFNGSYVGYIAPESYKNISHAETREMNWTGWQSGAYFQEITEKLLAKINK